MGVVVIAGVPGVGKSTLLQAASRERGYPIVVFGSEMLSVALERGLVRDRDDLRKLPPHLQREIQKEAAERISKMGKVLVDTHFTIRTPKGYLPGIPLWVAERLSPTLLVLVEAPPKEILERRARDFSRRRDEETVESIEEQQLFNRIQASVVSFHTGATVHVVTNRQGRIEEAQRVLLHILD